jgi:sec-independent protein translocase protein TatA
VPFGLGIWEIVILAGILVLLFGAKGAPGMARRLGSGVKEMKDAVTELDPRSILDPKDKPAEVPPRQLEASKAVPVTAAPVAPAPVAVVPEAVPVEAVPAEAVPAEAVPAEPPTQEAVPPEGESPSA